MLWEMKRREQTVDPLYSYDGTSHGDFVEGSLKAKTPPQFALCYLGGDEKLR